MTNEGFSPGNHSLEMLQSGVFVTDERNKRVTGIIVNEVKYNFILPSLIGRRFHPKRM